MSEETRGKYGSVGHYKDRKVRATDADGATQDAVERPPPPDGATGYYTVTVEVV